MQRRDLLKKLGLGSLALALAELPVIGKGAAMDGLSESSELSRKSLRIAHITDVHIQKGIIAETGFANCLQHIQSLRRQPDVIFNTGDSIMDALGKDREEVDKQWKVWHDITKNENSIDIYHAIGNHDVWGKDTYKNDPLYGKKFVQQQLELSQLYYSFKKKDWHFIVLDSTHINADGTWYHAQLDEAQFEWLKKELQRVPKNTPIAVLSHIPILAACVFMDGENERSGNWQVPSSWMHIDARKIIDLFHKHKNVKLCLSGHIHLFDKVVYNDVTYLCQGAVSGAWWGGKYHETPAGYGILDLHSDGTFDHSYVRYSKEN
jgi:3',5'-cyclic AMP phosphodiesterase CpdA